MPEETPATPAPPETVVRAAWFGFAEIRRQPTGRRRLHLRWWRLSIAALGSAVALWLLAGLALYFFFKYKRGFEDERYVDDLFLPLHMQDHSRKMGEYYLKMADLHFKNNRLADAMQDYRLGVMRVPDALDARVMLSKFLFVYYRDQIQRSLQILEDGVPFAIQQNNPEYISGYLLRLQEYHFPDQAIAICRSYLAQNLANPEIRHVFAVNLVGVLTDQGRYDEADDALAKYQLGDTLDGVYLNARLLWERGRRRTAVNFLEKALERYPNNPLIYAILSGWYRDLGDLDKSREYITLRRVNNPNDVLPRIEQLYIYAKTGDTDSITHDSQEIIREFQTDPAAMNALATFAMNTGNVPLVRQVFGIAEQDAARNPAVDISPFVILVMETFVTVKDFDSAIQFADEIEQYNSAALKTQGHDLAWYVQKKPLIDSLRAVAEYGSGHPDLADIFIQSLLKSKYTPPDILMDVASRFANLGALPEAEILLENAHHSDPYSQAILTQLVDVELQMGSSANLSDHLRSLLNTRLPPLELLMDAYRKLGSDRFIFVPERQQLLDELDKYIHDAAKMNQVTES